jgi:hypothetical protein
MSQPWALLPDDILRVLESPTCTASPLYTALDAIQVALSAARIDVKLECSLISSAVERERELLTPFESADSEQLEKLGEDKVKEDLLWKAEKEPIACKAPGSRVRTALGVSNIRWTLAFDPKLAFGTHKIEQLVLWTDNYPTDAPEIVKNIHVALHKAATAVAAGGSRLHSIEKFDRVFADLEKTMEARRFLAGALAEFDERLRGQLAGRQKEQLPEGTLENVFLNQFFWVTGRKDKPSGVTPIFLPKQLDRLRQQARLLRSNEDEDTIIERMTSYRLDSNSLFSAFPAETSLSVYVQNWLKEPLTEKPEIPNDQLSRRQLFRDLTSAAHKLAAKDAGLEESEKLNLFCVPVLVGEKPLLVVAISLPVELNAELRGVLASPIRSLGGIMELQSELYTLRAFEHQRSTVRHHAIAHSIAHDIVGKIPALTENPLITLLEELERGKSKESNSARRELKEAVKSLQRATEEAGRALEFYHLGFYGTIDLGEALANAIAGIPDSILRKLYIRYEPVNRKIMVNGLQRTLEMAFIELIINAAEACAQTEDPKLTIDVNDRVDHVEITFANNGTELKGEISVGEELGLRPSRRADGTPQFGHYSAGREFRSLGGNLSVGYGGAGACLTVTLPKAL